jgi:hypothetical protein
LGGIENREAIKGNGFMKREYKKHNVTCQKCGDEFESTSPKAKYCIGKCWGISKTGIIKCDYCGTLYSKRDRRRYNHRYCSQECGLKHNAEIRRNNSEIKERPCKICGKIFRPRDSRDKGIYCSKKCYGIDRRIPEHERVPEYKNVYFSQCKECGKYFTSRHRATLCSLECRKKHYAKRSQEKATNKYISRIIICKHCGKNHITEYGRTRSSFCSDGCLKKYTGQTAKAKRRAITRGIKAENINPIEIFMRDGWICQLCGKRTLKSKRGTYHDRAPELDHITPIAHNGEHIRSNVQCACRICNQIKNAQIKGQYRMF